MNYIKFNEAHSELMVPDLGQIPFFIEGSAAVCCVQFTDDEIKYIKRMGNRLYLIGPVAPGGDRPLLIKPAVTSPFLTINPLKNGFQISGDPSGKGPSDDK